MQHSQTTTPFHYRRLVFVLGALFLVAAVHSALWAGACLRLDQGLRDAVVQARAQGWAVAARSTHWGGWPLAAEIVLDNVAARNEGDAFPPEAEWMAESVRIRLSLRHPTRLRLLPAGHQSFAARGLAKIPFISAAAVVDVDLTGIDAVEVSVRGLEASLPGRLRIETATVRLPDNALAASLAGIELPGVRPAIETLEAHVHLQPPFPAAATGAQSARDWRAAGGQVEVDDARLGWSPMTAEVHASGGLDADLQPDATGELTATALPELIDRLAAAGTLPLSSAMAAKAVLAVLGAPTGGKALQLPIVWHGGIVSVARFPLLRMAPLAWD